MKNILRVFLLAVLMLVASKVLFSDFNLFQSANNAAKVIVEK